MTPRVLLLPALLCCLVACDDTVFCSDSVEPAIDVEIRDSESGLPAAELATGYVRDGDYVDSLRTARGNGQGVPLSLQAADERPGVYTVVVIKDGYQTWRKDGVRVGRDECHVRTASLIADLVPTTK
jgi:predicted lipoprotein with Yx(FWY)xxD motif